MMTTDCREEDPEDEYESEADRLDEKRDREWGQWLERLMAKATLTPEEAEQLRALKDHFGEK